MKKTTIPAFMSIILVLITFTTVQAKEYQGTGSTRFGLKAGVNFSGIINSEAENTQSLTGFNVGVFSKMHVTKHISIQPELYFTIKGAEVTYNTLLVDGTARFHLNYIEFPLLLVVNLTNNVNVHAGPYAAYLISGIAKNESTVNLFNFEQNIDSNDYNRFDAGLAIGAGLDLGGFSLGVRYNYGMTNIGKEKTFLGITYKVPDGTNSVASCYVSISLN